MLISQVLNELHKWAPFNYQESYDNSGLLIGSPNAEVRKVLISLDTTEEVLEKAIFLGADLIISHHPVIFQGLKSLTGKTPEERVVIKALKHDIAIIAMHTNLDNVSHGVNAKIAELLALKSTSILVPKVGNLKKLVVFVPHAHLDHLRNSLFEVGAGNMGNYDKVSYVLDGEGSFRANENAQPFVGDIGSLHKESEARLELIFPAHLQSLITKVVVKEHPYEEVAFDIYSLENTDNTIGAGIIGELDKAIDAASFLKFLKDKMQTKCIKHTPLHSKLIKRIAVCGGSGSFLIKAAKAAEADIYITGDVKYHEFFEGSHDFIIADIGHYESEQFTKELIYDFLANKFPEMEVAIAEEDPKVMYS